ncbi:hypothetical protein J4444_04515 [Candidatus Woesearchaeota archaeon]|nr:hypothetical protein [Candidatus Woesearchaeota archaeon]
MWGIVSLEPRLFLGLAYDDTAQIILNTILILNRIMVIKDLEEFEELRRAATTSRILEKDIRMLVTTEYFRGTAPLALQTGLVEIYTPHDLEDFFRGEGEWVDQYTLVRRLINDLCDGKRSSSGLDKHTSDLTAAPRQFGITLPVLNLGLATRLIEKQVNAGVLTYFFPPGQNNFNNFPRVYLE